jgi:hypothetical protein
MWTMRPNNRVTDKVTSPNADVRAAQLERRSLMVRLFICLGMLSLACLASPKNSVEVAAKAFWSWHALRQPSGTLTADELAEVRNLLTQEFTCLLEVAGKFNLQFAKLYPDDKPPFEEGDFFTSSAYEPATKFRIESIQANPTTAIAFTRFYAEGDASWVDRLQLRQENGQWKVSDVDRGGPFEFGNRGSLVNQLYAAMSPDLPAASWSGTAARNCRDKPNPSLERTREK